MQEEGMPNNIYGAIALTGGGTGALDAIDGTALAANDMAFVVVGGFTYTYYLHATLGATESSPGYIVPDANAGTKVWVLTEMYRSNSAIKNPLAHAQGIKMTYAASGSGGIVVADNAHTDLGTGNFTVVFIGSLLDWTPSVTSYLFEKYKTIRTAGRS